MAEAPLTNIDASGEKNVSCIHPLACVHPDARLGETVSVGPFCQIEADVEIGDGCTLEASCSVKNGVRLGRENHIYEGAVLGGRPQYLGAGEELGQLIIGDGNHIRENATLHRGLKPGKDTIVGGGNFFMVGVHIGHDCQVGNNVIMANNAMLGGHVTVQDRAFLSGNVAVHQFCRIGSLAMVGGQARVTRDIPPFVMIDGQTSLMVGLNKVGLKRAGFTRDEIAEIKAIYRYAFSSDLSWNEILASLPQKFPTGHSAEFAEFLAGGTRGFVRERRESRAKTLRLRIAAESVADVPESTNPPSEYRKAG